MFCPSCGNMCAEGTQTCPSCGHSFATANTNTNPTYNAEPYQPTGYQPVVPKKSNNAPLILGIVGLVINLGLGCLCGCLGMLPGIVCAIIGLVLAIKAKKDYAPGEKDKNVEIGFILCIVALGLAVVITIVNFIFGAALGSEMGLY